MTKKIKNICCIGAGYVGGPTMAVFADKCPHLNIVVVDKNIQRVELNSSDLNRLPIYEKVWKNYLKNVEVKTYIFIG